jgi:hypothetical protein
MKRALHIAARTIATAALLVGGTCLLIGLAPNSPPARKAELHNRIEELRLAKAELEAEIARLDARSARATRLATLPPLLRALEPDSDLTAPFLGIVTRDSAGKLSACETLTGRTPSDYADYLPAGPEAGTWLIGRVKPTGDMTYSTRISHPVTPEGRILVVDSPTPVMLAQLRERIAR